MEAFAPCGIWNAKMKKRKYEIIYCDLIKITLKRMAGLGLVKVEGKEDGKLRAHFVINLLGTRTQVIS